MVPQHNDRRTLESETSIPARGPSAAKEPKRDAVERARDVADLLDRMVRYLFISCVCGVRIKVPPADPRESVRCPRCGLGHEIPREEAARGTAILLTTHNMSEADELSDRVAFIDQGKIHALDTPERLKLEHGRRAVKVRRRDGEEVHEDEIPLQAPDAGARLEAAMMAAVGMIAGAAGQEFMTTMFLAVVLMVPMTVPTFAVLFPGSSSLWVQAMPSFGFTEALVELLGYGRAPGELLGHVLLSAAWALALSGVALWLLKRRMEAL